MKKNAILITIILITIIGASGYVIWQKKESIRKECTSLCNYEWFTKSWYYESPSPNLDNVYPTQESCITKCIISKTK